jgi:hypothetical protein
MNCEYPVAHRLLDVSRQTQVNGISRAPRVGGQHVVVRVEEVRSQFRRVPRQAAQGVRFPPLPRRFGEAGLD